MSLEWCCPCCRWLRIIGVQVYDWFCKWIRYGLFVELHLVCTPKAVGDEVALWSCILAPEAGNFFNSGKRLLVDQSMRCGGYVLWERATISTRYRFRDKVGCTCRTDIIDASDALLSLEPIPKFACYFRTDSTKFVFRNEAKCTPRNNVKICTHAVDRAFY